MSLEPATRSFYSRTWSVAGHSKTFIDQNFHRPQPWDTWLDFDPWKDRLWYVPGHPPKKQARGVAASHVKGTANNDPK